MQIQNHFTTMKEEAYANELDNITVSYSHDTHNPYLTQTTLGNILDRIKQDTELERIIDEIRSESDKDKRRQLKEDNLPSFVLGTFENNHRKSSKLNKMFQGKTFKS
jgi:methionine salvage enolase-phosphatase E1